MICTAGHPNEFLTQTGIAESIRNIMLDDRLGNRFENKELLMLGGTLQLDQVRAHHSKQLTGLISRLMLSEAE